MMASIEKGGIAAFVMFNTHHVMNHGTRLFKIDARNLLIRIQAGESGVVPQMNGQVTFYRHLGGVENIWS